MEKITIKEWDQAIDPKQKEALCEVYDLLSKLESEHGSYVGFPTDNTDMLPFLLSIVKQKIDALIENYIEANVNGDNKERVKYYFGGASNDE